MSARQADTPRMRSRLLLGVLLLAAALPANARASSATIDSATATPDWTQATVGPIHVTWDLCAANGATPCDWTAIAGVITAATGSCPQDWNAPTVRSFWAAPSNTDGTLSSDAHTVTLNGAYGQRVCVWGWHMVHTVIPGGTFNGITTPDQVIDRKISTLLTSRLMSVQPLSAPTVAPAAVAPAVPVVPSVAPTKPAANCSAEKKALRVLSAKRSSALRSYRRHRTHARKTVWQKATRAYTVLRKRVLAVCP